MNQHVLQGECRKPGCGCPGYLKPGNERMVTVTATPTPEGKPDPVEGTLTISRTPTSENTQRYPQVCESEDMESVLMPEKLRPAFEAFLAARGLMLTPPMKFGPDGLPTRIITPTDETMEKLG